MITHEVTYFQTFRLESKSSSAIFVSKILKQWIKYSLYEPYFGINFGNVKKCKISWENLHKIEQKTSVNYIKTSLGITIKF